MINLTEKWMEAIGKSIINSFYLLMGPLLLMLVNIGICNLDKLAYVCGREGRHTDLIKFGDIMLILFCLGFSSCVTITMFIQKTLNMAQATLSDPNSITFKIAHYYLN